MRVLVIEDETPLREQLTERLTADGLAVDCADNGVDGLFLGQEHPYDVMIIDLGLPGMLGIDVIKTLRSEGNKCPILILTARGRWNEKVEGLEAGADDYMVKPFHIEELLARLKVLTRRAAGWAQSVLQCGVVALNTSTQAVTVNDEIVDLTSYEYKVLEHLMLHAGEVISKTDLTEHLYDQDFDRDSNVIEVFIRRLRKKLDPDKTLQPIETLRGRGYRFTLERLSS